MWISRGGRSSSPHASDLSFVSESGRNSFNHQAEKAKEGTLTFRYRYAQGFVEIVKTERAL